MACNFSLIWLFKRAQQTTIINSCRVQLLRLHLPRLPSHNLARPPHILRHRHFRNFVNITRSAAKRLCRWAWSIITSSSLRPSLRFRQTLFAIFVLDLLNQAVIEISSLEYLKIIFFYYFFNKFKGDLSLKCRNCILIGHEHCITANQHLINECHSAVLKNGNNGINAKSSSSSKDHLSGSVAMSAAAEVAAVAARHGLASSLLPPLDTSSYSVQTSSSCSTTPNSNYSSQHATNSHQNQGGATNGAGSSSSGLAVNSASAVAYQQCHGCKLDTDIGSACGKQFIFKHFLKTKFFILKT